MPCMVPVPVSSIDSKLFPNFKDREENDVFLNAFEMECELNKVGQEDMVQCCQDCCCQGRL